jgi:hypothetical protein
MALARDSVLLQQRLDAEAAASRERFAALLASVPQPARGLLLPLRPNQLIVQRHDVTCSLRVATSRTIAFELSVKPINVGFAALYETTTTEQASLSIEVRSVSTPDTVT